MKTLDEKLTQLYNELDLGDVTETKKLFLLDEINSLLTKRILLKLIESVPNEKRSLFIEKIDENKDDPNKIVLFIDHFVDNANEIINNEIYELKKELLQKLS